MAITINQEQGLYVIPSGSGFSCWGFQNADDEARELHRRTGGAVPAPTATPGAVDHYEECRAIISAYGKLAGTRRTIAIGRRTRCGAPWTG